MNGWGRGWGNICNKSWSRRLLCIWIVTCVVSSLYATLTKQNITQNNFIISTHRTHDCTSAQCIFTWNTSAAGYKEGTIVFPQRIPLPRSYSNSTVSDSGTTTVNHIQMYPLSTLPLHFIWPQNSEGIFICFPSLFSCSV